MYPSAEEIESMESNQQYVPESLQVFLNSIIDQKKKDRRVIAIGQAIVQAAIPRQEDQDGPRSLT